MSTSLSDGPRGPAPQVVPRRAQAAFASVTFDDLPVAVLQFAVGMIGQRHGLQAVEAAERLRAYAAAALVPVAAAARLVVDGEVDIDTMMSVPTMTGAPR